MEILSVTQKVMRRLKVIMKAMAMLMEITMVMAKPTATN